MRELQLVLSDDMTFARTGERVPADETVVIALDGKARELDLTAENAKKLREFLAPWIDAGHAPGQQDTTAEEKTAKDFSQVKRSRDRSRLVRDFADSIGLKSEDGTRPIYRTESGGYYYPYKLRKMYAEHVAAEKERGLIR